MTTINVTDKQTDRRTICCSNTALCSKNCDQLVDTSAVAELYDTFGIASVIGLYDVINKCQNLWFMAYEIQLEAIIKICI